MQAAALQKARLAKFCPETATVARCSRTSNASGQEAVMSSSEEGLATLDSSGGSQIALQQSAVPADTESWRQLPTSPCSVVDADDLGCEQPVPERAYAIYGKARFP